LRPGIIDVRARYRAAARRLRNTDLVNSPPCKEPKGSLQCSEGPLQSAYSEPDGSCAQDSYLLFFFFIFCGVLYATVNVSD